MKRAMTRSAFVAMGILLAGAPVAAQNAPTSGGKVIFGTLTAGSVGSSKFTEYRSVPNGVSVPFVNLFSKSDDLDFNLSGYNVRQNDQRYNGWLNARGMGLKFDYNQIPHDMGNAGRTVFTETAPGEWTASKTLRQALQTAIDTKLPTSSRTYDFYAELFAPSFASANSYDVSGVRKTGNVELKLGQDLPFDMTLTYKQELKSGYRGLGGGTIRGGNSPVYQVPFPLNELTQDFGLRTDYMFKSGNVYATFNRNLYNNRAETLNIDNLIQAVDAPRTSGFGGPSSGQWVMAPDNEATTGTAGFQLKTKYQTRFSGGVALSTRTQDAPFYAYTPFTLINNASGVPASSLAALPQASYGGKVNTTMYNLAFSSRPVDGLAIRAKYRVYDLTDKSKKWIITGDVSDAGYSWNTVTPSTENPFGHATANIYDTKTRRFSASATYDYGPLTVEGSVRSGKLERTSREALKGSESGWAVTGLFHATDMLGVRATYDEGKRKATGETVYGFQLDEAPFTNKRTGLDVELTPTDGLDLSFGYFRRDVEYTDRPDRVQVSGGVPVVGATPIPNTPSGLLNAKYDSWTGEINYSAAERFEIGAYYTYEKDAHTNQWSTTSGANLNNLLNWAGSDKTNTYGATAIYQIVPDKHTFTLNAMSQKVDGLMDITAREEGSFYTPGRTGLIPAGQGGAADITDWDDTKITTLAAQFDFMLNKGWALTTGYVYEKYEFSDAYTANSNLQPSRLIFLMKPDRGAYDVSLVYAGLKYHF